MPSDDFAIRGYRAHMNGGKKLYFGIKRKESNILVMTLVKVTSGDTLGRMLYVFTEANMNGNDSYNATIDGALEEIEAGAGAS